ncbi:peptidyl-prolyl cis-trans isomerase FKBP4 [Caerostris extrusa]|uniref:peptidylprolyl isomerase n=1 Tax=Caerostris extrusa TaxID=172846 RepID=A0AAV4WLY1_CAEEX|nr:peptidyl-prolyl cis-trans isomerase FKBP4 [Caerostris extrusa]
MEAKLQVMCLFIRKNTGIMSTEADNMETENEETWGPDVVDISPNQDKGVLKKIITPGENDDVPCKGNKVFVHYVGKLKDGTEFDSSVGREVIKAWDIGVATMKKGEKCLLICHPDYAYGNKGSPPKIPENATLLFEVELIKWQMEDISSNKDNGILRSILTEGEGYISPSDGSVVEVHLIGTYDGKEFEERDVKFELGEGSEVGIVEGLETALTKFKKGETSKIILAPKYAFGSKGNAELNVPPNAAVEYKVTLKSFEKEKETWNMTFEEKIEQAEIVKNKGTNFFKKKFDLAEKQYQKIITYLQYESEAAGADKDKKDDLLKVAHLNLAACFLKLEKFGDVLESCDKALAIEPNNSKAFFRRGKAYLALQECEKAKENFTKVLEYEPSNTAAKKVIQICNLNLKKQLDKEKKMYQTIFKKLAEQKDVEPDTSTPEDSQNQNEKMDTDDEKPVIAETISV